MPERFRSSDARSQPGRLIGLALGWLLAYAVFFYGFSLPNNPAVSRRDIWLALPELLLANVLPAPPEANALPSGWCYLPQRFDLMLVAGVILAGAWGLGHLIVRLLSLAGRKQRSRLDRLLFAERTVFAFGLGLSGLSLITLGCGLAGWLSRPLLGGLLAVFVAIELGLRLWKRLRRKRVVDPNHEDAERRISAAERGVRYTVFGTRYATGFPVACLLTIAPFLLAMLLGSMLPPVDFDVKEYHLQGPKEFFQNGQITFLPHNVYTSFPSLTEMLSLLAMVLRDDWYRGALAGKAVLMSFAPLTALALYAAGRRWFSPTVGWLAATVHLTTPWVYRISIIAYVEGGLTFYLFATLLAVMLLAENRVPKMDNRRQQAFEPHDENPETGDAVPGTEYSVPRTQSSAAAHDSSLIPDRSSLIPFSLLAGLLAGSAMACKYTGVLQVVIPLGGAVCLAPIVLKRPANNAMPLRTAVQSAGVFGLGVLLTIGPWLLKNTVETGNPVYPLMYSVFGGRDWDADLNAKWWAGHSPPTYSPNDLAVKFIDVTAKSDWLSPLLFSLAPLALLLGRNRKSVRWLGLYAGFLFLAWWTFTHRIDRFWVPMIPVISLLAGIGAAGPLRLAGVIGPRPSLWDSSEAAAGGTTRREVSRHRRAAWTPNRWWKLGCGAFIAFAVLFNLAFITTPLCGYNQYLSDLGAARRDTQTESMRLLNQSLPPESKVLCVGEAQVFDARFRVVYNTVFDDSIVQQWCAEPERGVPATELSLKPAAEIRRTFQKHGITHVFVNWEEILRYRTTYGYTDFVTPKRFADLQRRGVLEGPRLLTYPETFPPVQDLSATEQAELRSWAPEVVVNVQGTERMIPLQLFRVKR